VCKDERKTQFANRTSHAPTVQEKIGLGDYRLWGSPVRFGGDWDGGRKEKIGSESLQELYEWTFGQMLGGQKQKSGVCPICTYACSRKRSNASSACAASDADGASSIRSSATRQKEYLKTVQHELPTSHK
jgi:hypothetical protein